MRWGERLGFGLLAIIGLAWLISLVSGYDVVADVHPARRSLAPSAEAWLGTDHLGRDVMWRLVTASEAFVGPGLVACAVAATLGIPVGAVAGYTGGWWGRTLRFLFSVVGSIPRFVLVLLACTIHGSSSMVLAVAAGLSYCPTLGEAVYARIEFLRRSDFVEAARAHGVSVARIISWHLLWVNCRRLVARHLLQLFGYTLVLETTLSYIGGFGIEEPNPSWGNMLAFEFGVSSSNPWAWLAPALAIWLSVLGTVLAADRFSERTHG